MEKIRKIDVGTLLANDSNSEFEDSIRKRSYMVFENGGHVDDSSRIYELNGEHCYIISKADLDAYIARKEDLEKTKGTPDWYLSNRIKQLEAENTNLRDINKSLGEENSKLTEKNEALKDTVGRFYGMTSAGEELRAANEKLAAEVEELKERIDHLKIIQRLLAKENTSLLTENNKLHGTKNELNATVTWLKQELAKFHGEHVIGWTEVSGAEHELTFLTPERTIHE